MIILRTFSAIAPGTLIDKAQTAITKAVTQQPKVQQASKSLVIEQARMARQSARAQLQNRIQGNLSKSKIAEMNNLRSLQATTDKVALSNTVRGVQATKIGQIGIKQPVQGLGLYKRPTPPPKYGTVPMKRGYTTTNRIFRKR